MDGGFKRYEASGPVVIGMVNQNIVTNLRRSAPTEMHLPSLRTLAKMVYDGHEFLDNYAFDITEDSND